MLEGDGFDSGLDRLGPAVDQLVEALGGWATG
jgi:hypothetical protein